MDGIASGELQASGSAGDAAGTIGQIMGGAMGARAALTAVMFLGLRARGK
jgi:hypothetical protein